MRQPQSFEKITTIPSVATNPAVEERPKQTLIIPSAIETEVLRYDPVAIAAYRKTTTSLGKNPNSIVAIVDIRSTFVVG